MEHPSKHKITQAPGKIESTKRNIKNFFKNPKRGRFIKDVATLAVNVVGPGKMTKLGQGAKKFKQFATKFNVR
tara:strand:- start:43 stop:261 length:219 start_codon:yes stop_codon:yes gene_type:complete